MRRDTLNEFVGFLQECKDRDLTVFINVIGRAANGKIEKVEPGIVRVKEARGTRVTLIDPHRILSVQASMGRTNRRRHAHHEEDEEEDYDDEEA